MPNHDSLTSVALDLHDVAHLVAGGEIHLPDLGIKIVPGSDIFRISKKVRTRENGGRLVLRGFNANAAKNGKQP